jgi:hypothetical protein
MNNAIFHLPAAIAVCALLAACAQPEASVQPLPLGPTAEEVAEYARAQVEYRSAQASGNDDAMMQAITSFSQISGEILSRQDPKLFEAEVVCERQSNGQMLSPGQMGPIVMPQFARPCEDIARRYNEVSFSVRRDLQARIEAADRATIAQGLPDRY